MLYICIRTQTVVSNTENERGITTTSYLGGEEEEEEGKKGRKANISIKLKRCHETEKIHVTGNRFQLKNDVKIKKNRPNRISMECENYETKLNYFVRFQH